MRIVIDMPDKAKEKPAHIGGNWYDGMATVTVGDLVFVADNIHIERGIKACSMTVSWNADRKIDPEPEPKREPDDTVIWTTDTEKGWIVEVSNKDFAENNIETVIINGVEFTPKPVGSLHTRMNMIEERIREMEKEIQTVKNESSDILVYIDRIRRRAGI